MELPGYTGIADSAAHPTHVLSSARGPNNQILPHLQQASGFKSQTVYLNAIPVPLYQLFQPPLQQLAEGQHCSVDRGGPPMILSPIVHSEKTDLAAAIIQKKQGPNLTVNILNTLPILPPGSYSDSSNGSPVRPKNAGKYTCKHCGRDCLKPSVLEKHIRSHTGERPFPCTTCGIAFKTQSNLYKHRRTQTHVNNTRLSSESDSSILEESEKPLETSVQEYFSMLEGHLSDGGSHLTDKVSILSDRGGPINENVIHLGESQKLPKVNRITETRANNPEQSISSTDTSLVPEYPWDTLVHQKAQDATVHLDNANPKELLEGPQSIHYTAVMSPVSNANKKLQEQRILTASKHGQLQWQQTMYSERPLECPSSERKLKKCESTDSGYLSHSDSVDQQTWSSSPLHSLCEQSSETENEQNVRGSGASPPNTSQQAEKTSPFLLEKNQLEEHISKLISQNKALVDNNQLANVRPRKTLLSKQGSIDLPMPYTFKDSFHFDIKSLGGSRKTNYSLCTAKSTFTPLQKSKPLFFHSVPTQFSTTVDCVAVTRSNSSPLVESTINLQEQSAKSKLSILQHQPLGARFSGLLQGGQLTTSLMDCHNSHPRSLVRQTAVEYTLSSQADDYSPNEVSKDCSQARGQKPTTKKGSRKKLKMFSQEKWQMYGDETFKKIYQQKNDDSAKKLRDQEEIHLNTLTNLVSNLHVQGSRSSFLQKTNNRPLASYPGVSSVSTLQLDNSLHDRRVASQQHNHISFLEPSDTSKTSDDTPKIRRSKTVSVQGQSSLASVALGVNSGGSIMSVNCSRSRMSQPQQMTGKPITILSKPEDLIQPHLDLRRSNTSIATKSCIPLLGHVRTAGHNTMIGNKESQQHVQTIFRLGGSSSVDPIKDSGELPSERKKLKVEELENSNKLHVNSSAINAKHEDLGVTATELDHYPVSDQSNPLDIHEEKLETIKSIATCPSGIASEKTFSHLSGLSSLDTSRSFLHEAAPSLSVLCFTSQCPETTNEKDWMTEKQDAQSNSSDVQLSPCLVVKSHPSQVLVCTSPTSQQGLVQSAALPQGMFSPKYQLKLPVLEAMEDLPYTTANHLTDTITRDTPRPEARSHSAQPAVASRISGPLHSELTPLSVIEKPPTDATAEKTAFTIGFPSTSSAVSTVICMAYSGFGKSITWLNRNKDHCLQKKESVKMQSKNKPSTTKIDSLVQKSIMTPSCLSVDCSNCLLFANYECQYKPVKHHSTGTSQVLATSALGSGTPFRGKQEKPAECWRTHTSCSSSGSGPPLNLHNSGSQFNISAGNSGEFYTTTDISVFQTLTMQERGASILQQKGLRSGSGNNKASMADVHYPSLTTEPNMTWCCLARNVPFVVQQKTDDYASCPSLHVCPQHLVAGRSDPSWKVSLLDTRNVSTLSARSSTAKESGQVEEPLTLNQKEQHKRNPVTITTSMKNSDFTAKKRALWENKQVLMKRSNVHKKLKITKKRGGLIPGHAHVKPNRMCKQQLLTNKVSFVPKKHPPPKTPHGLDGRRKSSHAGKMRKKDSKTKCGNKNIAAIPERSRSGEQRLEEDKYTVPPVEPGHAISTSVIASERAVPEEGEMRDRKAALTSPNQPISFEGTVEAREMDMPNCINECPNMAADFHCILASHSQWQTQSPGQQDSSEWKDAVCSAALSTTNSIDCLDLMQPSLTSDSFSLPEYPAILQKPAHVEWSESTYSGSNRPSSPWSFTADDSNTFTQPLLDNMNPELIGVSTRGNPTMIMDHLVSPMQCSTTPSRDTTFCTEHTEVEKISKTCLSVVQDSLLGVQIACSLPYDSVSTTFPSTLVRCCGFGVHKLDQGHVSGSTPNMSNTFLEDHTTSIGWANCSKSCQETKTAVFESSLPLLGTLEMKATSDLTATPVKTKSLEMMRKNSQVEYTDTSSDDDRLVIEM